MIVIEGSDPTASPLRTVFLRAATFRRLTSNTEFRVYLVIGDIFERNTDRHMSPSAVEMIQI